MRGSIGLGRLIGIPLRLHYSWFLVLLLFTYSLAMFLGELRPLWSSAERWVVALAASIMLFVSVIAHELCHSLVALRYGIPVRAITLFMFGGAAHIAREAPRPGVELLIALAGPVCSVLLGLVFLGVGFLVERFSVHVAVIMSWLFLMNMALGIFNLVPGFPLDGGRVLRAVIWAVSGNYAVATRVATMGGYATALLLMGLGAYVFIASRSALQGMWLALVGWFLWQAAFASYRQHKQRRRLESMTARDLMSSVVPEVSPDARLQELIDSGALRGGRRGLVVVEDGRAVGLISAVSVGRMSRGARAAAQARHAMTPLERTAAVAPDDGGDRVLEALEDSGVGMLPVVETGELLGVITPEDVTRKRGSHDRSRADRQ